MTSFPDGASLGLVLARLSILSPNGWSEQRSVAINRKCNIKNSSDMAGSASVELEFSNVDVHFRTRVQSRVVRTCILMIGRFVLVLGMALLSSVSTVRSLTF